MLATGSALLWWAQARVRRMRPLREAAAGSTVADLTTGRFRVVGRVVPIRTTRSAIDRAPCVYVERAEYRTLGSELVPLLREVDHRVVGHPFYLDDGTGRVRVDPVAAVVDTSVAWEDEGLLAERRLRAGDEVELVACFEPRETTADGGPYRAGAMAWQAVEGAFGPPRLSERDDALSIAPSDDIGAFLRGLGVFILILGLGMAVLATV